jgi:hypothetical protein
MNIATPETDTIGLVVLILAIAAVLIAGQFQQRSTSRHP